MQIFYLTQLFIMHYVEQWERLSGGMMAFDVSYRKKEKKSEHINTKSLHVKYEIFQRTSGGQQC